MLSEGSREVVWRVFAGCLEWLGRLSVGCREDVWKV